MSEENLEVRAKDMGWTPQEQFKGDPAKWVDAATYVERGEQVLPILQKTNRDLHGRLTEANTKINELTQKVESTDAVIEDLKKFHTESMAERVKEARAKLIREQEAARKDDNIEEVIRTTNDLADLNNAETAAKKEEKTPPAKREATNQPDAATQAATEAWMRDNSWFQKDPVKTSLAMGIAEKLRSEGVTVTGRPFLDQVGEEVEKVLNPGVRREIIDRTESTRHSGNHGSGGSGSDYASLPADARAQCDKDASRFVGKPGFPDLKSWQTHFIQQYNAGA